jgi:ABC-2 type transport system permease protein
MSLAVVRTELTNFRRDRAAVLLAIVLPVAFFSVFSVIFGGSINAESRKVQIGIVDLDQSAVSKKLIGGLASDAALEIVRTPRNSQVPLTVDSAQSSLRAGTFPVALVIPRGFGSQAFDFSSTRRPQLQILADGSDPVAAALAAGMVQKALGTSLSSESTEAGLQLLRGWTGGLTPEQEEKLQANLAASRELQESSGSTDSVGIAQVRVRDVIGEEKENPVVAFYAAAMGVMFLLFSAARSGGSLLDEVDSGTLDRVLSTRITMTSLLFGKLIFLTALCFAQLWVMFLWGALVFDLAIVPHVPGIMIMSAVTAVAVSAFGLLLASACRTRAQLYAASTLLILIISAVGGSMFPRFLMPESVLRWSLLLFNSWALEGFLKIFWRGAPVTALWPEVVVLLLSGAVFFFIARRLARRWEYS